MAAWADCYDLRGAVVRTSLAPYGDLNCVSEFDCRDRSVEALLDIGFALLRAFDRPPAVQLNALDRPRTLGRRLRARGLRWDERSVVMAYRGDPGVVPVASEVQVQAAREGDVTTFVDLHVGAKPVLRRLSRASMLAGLLDSRQRFYLARLGGEPAGVAHVLCDGETAGIYALSTRRTLRRRGVATALLRRAIGDASDAGAGAIGLRTAARNPARKLFESLGFAPVLDVGLWTMPGK